jgi:hypothetical protein
MDDSDEDREFSKTLVLDYLQQAKDTFEKMDAALYVPSCSPATRDWFGYLVPRIYSDSLGNVPITSAAFHPGHKRG